MPTPVPRPPGGDRTDENTKKAAAPNSGTAATDGNPGPGLVGRISPWTLPRCAIKAPGSFDSSRHEFAAFTGVLHGAVEHTTVMECGFSDEGYGLSWPDAEASEPQSRLLGVDTLHITLGQDRRGFQGASSGGVPILHSSAAERTTAEIGARNGVQPLLTGRHGRNGFQSHHLIGHLLHVRAMGSLPRHRAVLATVYRLRSADENQQPIFDLGQRPHPAIGPGNLRGLRVVGPAVGDGHSGSGRRASDQPSASTTRIRPSCTTEHTSRPSRV